MMVVGKPKKKLLPKDFEALLKAGDLNALKSVFDTCDINARGGSFKQTALAFNECPDELARWLVEGGADLSAHDSYGDTPLHARSKHWQGRIDILLELGADVHHGEGMRGTPLHAAAGAYRVDKARVLIAHGARVDALNCEKQNPLTYALQRCANSNIERMAPLAELLITEGARRETKPQGFLASLLGTRQPERSHQTAEMKAFVTRIGTNFEFHRSGINPEFIDATDAGLQKLYELFGVPPVPRRTLHDGKSPIVAKAANWRERHQELWEFLVPSSGAAATIQGEAIRISGKIRDELERNGSANWDVDYKNMASAFVEYVGSGAPLPASELAEARAIVAEVQARRGDSSRLCELAVHWVALNPKPVKLPPPNYSR
jgi:hypothetical protein